MSADRSADVLVVGLGAVGSAVAHHLAALGAHVIGIDRYDPPHDRGSSHGLTRITRLAIGEGHAFVPLVQRSHALWRALEAESGDSLYERTGGIVIQSPDERERTFHGRPGFFDRTVAAARRFDLAHELLTPDEAMRRHPALALRGDESIYVEPDAGVLRVEPCVRAQLNAAVRRGAVLRTGERVTGFASDAHGVRVTTDRAVLSAGHVVIAAGPWAPTIVDAPAAGALVVTRQVMHWFATDLPELYQPSRLPVFIWLHGGDGGAFYGMPMTDGVDGVKVATEQFAEQTDPERVERVVSEAECRATFERHVQGRLRGVTSRAVRQATCLYTSTDEGRFIVARPSRSRAHDLGVGVFGARLQALGRSRRIGRATRPRAHDHGGPESVRTRAGTPGRLNDDRVRGGSRRGAPRAPRRRCDRSHRACRSATPTWNFAVWTEMSSRRAMVLFDAPSVNNVSTSSSRGVRPASSLTTGVLATSDTVAASPACATRTPSIPANSADTRAASAGSARSIAITSGGAASFALSFATSFASSFVLLNSPAFPRSSP